MVEDFLTWYLAPWRRMGRGEFGLWLLAASVPGFLLMVLGFADGASSWLAPILGLMDIGNQAQGVDLSASNAGIEQSLMQMNALHDKMTEVMNAANAAPAHAGFDWSGLFNNGLMMLMIPVVRMRLRDMGKVGWSEYVWTAVVSLTAVDGLLQVFGLDVFGSLSWVLSIASFVGFIWLCMAKSAPRVAVHENIPPPGPLA